MNNAEVMIRFGFKICPVCNSEQHADEFVNGKCKWCQEENE